MQRRALLAAPMIAPALAALPAAAQGAPRLVTEEHMVPSGDPGIELFVRNKRPETLTNFTPGRTVLFVHGATYPAHTSFDLPLSGLSWMDYMAGRGFDVWCLDIRGYGRSTRPPEMAKPASESPPIVRGETAVKDIATAASFIRQRRGIDRELLLIGLERRLIRLCIGLVVHNDQLAVGIGEQQVDDPFHDLATHDSADVRLLLVGAGRGLPGHVG